MIILIQHYFRPELNGLNTEHRTRIESKSLDELLNSEEWSSLKQNFCGHPFRRFSISSGGDCLMAEYGKDKLELWWCLGFIRYCDEAINLPVIDFDESEDEFYSLKELKESWGG